MSFGTPALKYIPIHEVREYENLMINSLLGNSIKPFRTYLDDYRRRLDDCMLDALAMNHEMKKFQNLKEKEDDKGISERT